MCLASVLTSSLCSLGSAVVVILIHIYIYGFFFVYTYVYAFIACQNAQKTEDASKMKEKKTVRRISAAATISVFLHVASSFRVGCDVTPFYNNNFFCFFFIVVLISLRFLGSQQQV